MFRYVMEMCIDFVQCPTVVRTVGFQSVCKWFIVCFVSIFEFWYMYYLKRKIQQIMFDVIGLLVDKLTTVLTL